MLVVDAGTSAVKAASFTFSGRVLASDSAPLTIDHPAPGRAEQQPDDWWRAFVAAVAGCRVPGRGPEALVVTGQMQDLVVVGADGAALAPALLYSDGRASAELAQLNARLGESWRHAAGNTQDASSTAAQLRWTSGHRPDVWRRAHRLLFGAPGYLVHRAGGGAWCDLTTASTTGLLDSRTHGWWRPVLDELDLSDELLPALVDGVTVTGSLARGPAAQLGLTAGLPIIHVAGDAGAVTEGLVGDQVGMPTISLGTSGWVAALSESSGALDEAVHRLVGPEGHGLILIAALLSAGATVDWARTTYLPGESHGHAERAIADLGPTGLLMLPSLAGERSPVRNPDALGAVVGLRPTTTAAHLYRASMEGVAYSLHHAMTLVGADSDQPVPLSGGAARSGTFRRILADVLQRPVLPVDAEGAGLHGALRAATRALGEPAPAPLRDLADPSTALHPGKDRYEVLRGAHRELWAALDPAFTGIARWAGG